MPIYKFHNELTGETKEVFQNMSDAHEYVSDDGTKWNRVWSAPNAEVDTKIDPFSQQDFADKTKNKKDKLGDYFSRSEELSSKRKDKMGIDPVKKKFWEKWSADRKGRPIPPQHLQ